MITDSTAPADVSVTDDNWLRKLAVIAVMTVLADWLFFRRTVGISLVLFVIALEVGVLVASAARPARPKMLAAAAILLAALLPFAEAPSVIAFFFCLAGAVYFAVVGSARATGPLRERAAASLWLLVAGPFQIVLDINRAYRSAQRGGLATSVANVAVGWAVPLVLGALFVWLFVSANPVIELWFKNWSLRDSLTRVDMLRVLFWLAAIVAVWPFVCMTRARMEEARAMVPGVEQPAAMTWPPRLLGEAAVVRSLILFNLLFAVQSALDIRYLWGGAALPDGMTYADYAHRGAYPLIVTALLAAAFVIVSMRPGSASERSPLIRALVFLWTGQNVLLVVSSILRLDLYVAVYSLTYMRVAAFVWMLLVAIGLVLIVARIMLYRSNAWLIAANLSALTLVVYICAFINFPYVIASYNVAHSREMSGGGVPLDLSYLIRLGPQALPALDDYIARGATMGARQPLATRRDMLAAVYLDNMRDWRAWSFRGWRIKRYLESAGGTPSPSSAGPAATGLGG